MSVHQPTLPDYCPNCNAPRTGNFCSNCGQKMEFRHEGFFHMLVHFVGHYFHYDGKFWSTLRYLLFKPGMLTRMYFEGKRASFLNPIQLYIFVSAIFFIVFLNSLKFYIDERGDLSTIRFYVGNEFDGNNGMNASIIISDSNLMDRDRDEIESIYQTEDSVYRATPFEFSIDYLRIALGRNIAAFALENRLYSNGDITIGLMNIFIRSIPKMFFVLLPWFAFLLWLFFSRRRTFLYVDHGVFALHFHAFTFICVMIGVLLRYVVPDDVVLFFFALLLPFVYLLIAIHKFYKTRILYTVLVGTLTGGLYAVSLSVFAFINVLLVMLLS